MRQANEDKAAFVWAGLDFDFAAMFADDAANDQKAEAGA